jgi:hypothetical protein
MPQATATKVDLRTSRIADRIARLDPFVEARLPSCGIPYAF